MYESGTLKLVEVILRRGLEKRENNGGNEPNQGKLYAHMEMSQLIPCTIINNKNF
jgi:hypothetical protein